MTLAVAGLLVFAVGLEPDLIGMDRSPVVGFVQVYVWLCGLALALLSAYAAVRVIRNGRPASLRSDIGLRLVSTGYVVVATASLADFLGIGSHAIRTGLVFGRVQILGLVVGLVTSVVGLGLYWPRAAKPTVDPLPAN
jgi:hypothetical protein